MAALSTVAVLSTVNVDWLIDWVGVVGKEGEGPVTIGNT